MIPLKTQLSTSISSSNSITSDKACASLKTAARFAALITGVGIMLCIPMGTRVFAKTGQPEDAKQAPTIDPNAMETLNKMGTYLRALKAFQVDADVTNEDVLDDGEIITDSGKGTVLAVHPNLLRVELKGDDKNVFLFYDGKNFTVYAKLLNYYATVPAPPTTDELITKIDNDYGIQVPLVDLFLWGTDQSTIKRITSAADIGPATVDGVTCEHYAFRQEGLDWQIWIQLGDFLLPRKIVIRTLTDDARPQHTSILSWNLAPSYNEAAFTFAPPTDSKRIPLENLNDGSASKSNQ